MFRNFWVQQKIAAQHKDPNLRSLKSHAMVYVVMVTLVMVVEAGLGGLGVRATVPLIRPTTINRPS